MIIFGWGKNARKEYGVVGKMRCFRCEKESPANLVKLYSYISLFFIPVIKLDEDYYLKCKRCGSKVQIFDENISRAKNNLVIIKNYKKGIITEEELKNIMASSSFNVGFDNPDDQWECPQCKHKNPNTTYVCKSCNQSLI